MSFGLGGVKLSSNHSDETNGSIRADYSPDGASLTGPEDSMKRKNVLGWALILFGAFSLIFGWPWGSLVGAILALAGVLALKLQQPQPTPPPPPNQAQREHSFADDELLLGVIRGMERRGESIPEELIDAAKGIKETRFEDWFVSYEALISKIGDIVVDLSALAEQIRSEYGLPTKGSVRGHPDAPEELDYILTRTEALGGEVPFLEAIFMKAILDPDGPEAAYLKERQKRAYPSLYDNEPHLEWNANPRFYERQLQRRHSNLLFPFAKRRVSRQGLYIACLLDASEANAFRQDCIACLKKITKMPSRAAASAMTDLLQQLNELLEKGASIGGNITEHLKNIHETYQMVLASFYEALKNDQESTEKLRAAEASRWSSNEKLLNPFIAQTKRMDSEDIIPALLSEETATIRLAVEMLGNTSEALEATRTGVIQLMNESPDTQQILRQQPEKLEALGIPS